MVKVGREGWVGVWDGPVGVPMEGVFLPPRGGGGSARVQYKGGAWGRGGGPPLVPEGATLPLYNFHGDPIAEKIILNSRKNLRADFPLKRKFSPFFLAF